MEKYGFDVGDIDARGDVIVTPKTIHGRDEPKPKTFRWRDLEDYPDVVGYSIMEIPDIFIDFSKRPRKHQIFFGKTVNQLLNTVNIVHCSFTHQ